MLTGGEMAFEFKDRVLPMSGHAYVMGIVNVTPDSFSDGGKWSDTDRAVEHALELVAEGAELLDIGGESTRPGFAAVPVEEEIRRVVPVIEELRRQTDVPLSVDTMKAAVAEAALAAGADILNDVTGLQQEFREKCELLRCTGAGCVVMHWERTAAGAAASAPFEAVAYVSRVGAQLTASVKAAMAASGLGAGHFMLDPGVGFGKTDDENWSLLAGLGALRGCGWPVLLGISRKSFLGRLAARRYGEQPEPAARLMGTAAATALGGWLGADVHRVHDARAMREVLDVLEAVRRHG